MLFVTVQSYFALRRSLRENEKKTPPGPRGARVLPGLLDDLLPHESLRALAGPVRAEDEQRLRVLVVVLHRALEEAEPA